MKIEKIFILGKGAYALSIILDILKLKGFQGEITVVSNIPDNENESIDFPFKTSGLNVNEITIESFVPSPDAKYVIGSIGKSRMKIFNQFYKENSIGIDQYINIIHPSAVIADSVELGNGVHVGPLSVIAPFTVVGNFGTINRNCSIGHHTTLKDFSCINPGVNISGICEIGMNTTIGAGATVLDQVIIGDKTIIGAGSVVTKNIPANVVAYGVPAKVIRHI